MTTRYALTADAWTDCGAAPCFLQSVSSNPVLFIVDDVAPTSLDAGAHVLWSEYPSHSAWQTGRIWARTEAGNADLVISRENETPISPAPLAISGEPGSATAGEPYLFAPTVTGGTGPYSFLRQGTLFAGFVFSPETGEVSAESAGGSGTMALTITVVDAANVSASLDVSIPVAGGAIGMPDGAAGIWYVDQADTSATRSVVPNEVTKASTTVPKPVNDPFVTVDRWSASGVTFTPGVSDEKGRPRGCRAVCSGSWSIRCDNFVNYNAGQHGHVLYAKATAPFDVRWGSGYDGSTNPIVTIGTNWTRLFVAQNKAAFADNPGNIVPVTPGSADITFGTHYVYEGASDPFPSGEAGAHLWLGTNAKTRKPAVAANELDIRTTGQVRALFDADIPLSGSITLMAAYRRTEAFASYQGLMQGLRKADDFGGQVFGAWSNYNGQPVLTVPDGSPVGLRDDNNYRLFDHIGAGYNIWSFIYDATTSRTYIMLGKMMIGGFTGASLNSTVSAFEAAFESGSGGYANSFASYPKALSKTELSAAVDDLRAKVTASSLTLDTHSRFVYWDGDSNMQGGGDANANRRSVPYLYKTASSYPHYGFVLAQNGGKLADMAARTPLYTFAPGPGSSGIKAVVVRMIGTNDGSTTFTSDANTYAANYKADCALLRAAPYYVIVVGCLPRTDANAAAGFETWRTSVNSQMAAAVGHQIDAYVDISANANVGGATAPDNTTYYYDRVHLTFGAGGGQEALLALVKPAVDAYLAA